MTGQIVLANSMASHNIKKSSRRDAGHRCSAFSQLMKQRLFQKGQAAKMYWILFISEYICQAGKFQRRLVPSTKWDGDAGQSLLAKGALARGYFCLLRALSIALSASVTP